MKTGVTVHRATAGFTVSGKSYPAGSLVVKTAQAFRPHVLDMFEPQDHPHDVAYPGGPPIPPYDSAGWTLAYQMGIEFDRVLDAFDGPFERLTDVHRAEGGGGAARQSGRLSAVRWPRTTPRAPSTDCSPPALSSALPRSRARRRHWFVEARRGRARWSPARPRELGVSVTPVAAKPAGESVPVARPASGSSTSTAADPVRAGSAGSRAVPSFHSRSFPADARRRRPDSRYDVLIVADDLIPERDRAPLRPAARSIRRPCRADRRRWAASPPSAPIPHFRPSSTAAAPSSRSGRRRRSPRTCACRSRARLVTRTATGDRPLKQEEYYIPGSVLRVRVDPAQPLAWGMPAQADVYFDNSPVFRLGPDAASRGVTPIAWFDSPTPLRSGWAWGQHYLDGGIAIAEAQVGKGRLVLSGPGDHLPRPAARHLQVPVQRAPTVGRSSSAVHSSLRRGASRRSRILLGVRAGELPLGWLRPPQVPLRLHQAARPVRVRAEQQLAISCAVTRPRMRSSASRSWPTVPRRLDVDRGEDVGAISCTMAVPRMCEPRSVRRWKRSTISPRFSTSTQAGGNTVRASRWQSCQTTDTCARASVSPATASALARSSGDSPYRL